MLGFKRNRTPEPEPIPEILPLYSLSEGEAAAVFVLVFVATCTAAWMLVPGLASAKQAWPRIFTGVCVLLGVFYTVSGFKHFDDDGLGGAIRTIVPPWGTWNFWYVPFSAEFHVRWTGAVEFVGGVTFLVGLLPRVPAWVAMWGARVLFVLTVLVTPANIYMLTHGALMPGYTDDAVKDGKPLSGTVHSVRQTIQVLLIATLCAAGQTPQKAKAS